MAKLSCILLITFLFFGCVNTGWHHLSDSFLIPLTSRNQDWSADNFGESTSLEDQKLIQLFKPRIFISPNGSVPIDFYKDYVTKSEIKHNKKVIVKAPSKELLKKYERSDGYYLDFKGEHLTCNGSCSQYKGYLYGRIYRETVYKNKFNSLEENKRLTILKYNPVFSSSGLPIKLKWYQSLVTFFLGSKSVWHELDIHGAIHIIIDEEKLKPKALVLSQHHHFRTYIIGKDINLLKGEKLKICFAERSNEPYLCHNEDKPRFFRTSANPKNFEYILNERSKGFMESHDLVYGHKSGGVEIDYSMKFLNSLDPLYVSWIPLGKKLKLMGVFPSFYRTAPPGMDINTYPELKNYKDLAQFWYIEGSDQDSIKVFNYNMNSSKYPQITPILNHNSPNFWNAYNR